MSEADFVKLAAAYRLSANRMAADIVSIWKHGSTGWTVSIDFCAADLVLSTVEVLS